MTTDTELILDNEYLGITEAAEYLRVSASTLRRWEKKGFLVPERTPTGIRRYTKKQLDDVIQAPQEHGSQTVNDVHNEVSVGSELTYANQSASNYNIEQQQIEALSYQTGNEPYADLSLNEIAPAPDVEINELRDFFKKAGYDTSATVEQNNIQTQSEWHSTSVQSSVSDQVQQVFPQTVTVEEPEKPIELNEATAPSGFANISEPSSVETVPQIESFWKKVHAPEQDRIEVFHEEHSDSSTTSLNDNRSDSQKSSYRTDLDSDSDEQSTSHSYQENQSKRNENGGSKKVLTLVAIVGLSVVVIAFIAWATYSYYSAPTDLYSAVVS